MDGETNDGLETWLKDAAGLQGKKLAVCLAACDEACVENVEDLRIQHTSDGLRAVFPAAIATLVGRALDDPSKRQAAVVTASSTAKESTSNDKKKRSSVVRRISVMET